MITLENWCKENNREDILARWSVKNEQHPSDVGYGSSGKVWWVCSLGHEWMASPNKMTQRTTEGCPFCAGQQVLTGYNDLQTKDPEVAEEWNIIKNGKLHPTDVAVSSNQIVWWRCRRGHEYRASVNDRTRKGRKRGCPYCANKRLLKGFNDLATVCPEVIKEWNYEKNEDLTPWNCLPSTHQRVWWRCEKGHEWNACLNTRISCGQIITGCPICANRKIVAGIIN